MDRQRQLPDGEAGFAVFVCRSAGFDPIFAVGGERERTGSTERHLGAVLAFENGVFCVLVRGVCVAVVLLAVGKRIDRSSSRLDRDLRGLAAGNRCSVRTRERQIVQNQRHVRCALLDCDGAVSAAPGQAVNAAFGNGQRRPIRFTAAAGDGGGFICKLNECFRAVRHRGCGCFLCVGQFIRLRGSAGVCRGCRAGAQAAHKA